MRGGTRVATEADIQAKAGKREFVAIEQIDHFHIRQKYGEHSQGQGIYTIGILTDKSTTLSAKTKERFTIFKLTDLMKYDKK